MSDIIERLAELSDLMMNDRPYNDSDFTDIDEAIDEIKRLRNELTERIHMCDMRSEKILELTAERDEARREVCQMKGTVRWNHYFPHFDPKGYAKNRGWDCLEPRRPWDCHKDYK